MDSPKNKKLFLQERRKDMTEQRFPLIDNASLQKVIEVVGQQKPVHICEIGSGRGWSGVHLADAVHQRGGKLTTFELSHPSYLYAQWVYSGYGLPNIVSYHGDFHKFGTQIDLGSVDFLFIDAHKSEYLSLYQSFEESWGEPKTVVFDDVIQYSEKISPLTSYLSNMKIQHSIVKTTDNDGILIIQR